LHPREAIVIDPNPDLSDVQTLRALAAQPDRSYPERRALAQAIGLLEGRKETGDRFLALHEQVSRLKGQRRRYAAAIGVGMLVLAGSGLYDDSRYHDRWGTIVRVVFGLVFLYQLIVAAGYNPHKDLSAE